MTFFYDLNKKLDDIREKPETTHKQLNEGALGEGWKGEVGGGVGGAALGYLLGGGSGLGTTIGAAVGAPMGRHLGGPDELKKEEQLNELAPILAAGAKALLPMLARIGPALSKAIQSPAVKQGAEVVARGTGKIAKQGTEIAAKNAIPIGIGAGAYSAITDLAQNVAGGVGQVYNDVSDAASEIVKAVGNAVDEKTIAELATMAVKYALPIGVVIALLYGGKKLIDKLMNEESVTEGDDMRDLLNKLDYVVEGYKGAMGGAALGSLVGGAPGAALGAIAGDALGDKMPSDPDIQKATSKIASKLSTAEGSTGDYSAKKARAGRDIGKPGKMFSKIAKDAGERYGSEERGEKVAGAVLAKLRVKNENIEEAMTDEKTAAQQALQALGQGNNQGMIKDLQRRAGVPQTGKVQPGQQPMSEDDVEEGNKFTGNLMKARAAGKKQADLDGDGDMEPVREAAKPDYIDLDNDGNRRESMKKAAADKKKHKHDVEEGIVDWAKEKYHDYQTGRQWNKFGKAQAKGDTAGMQAAQDAAAAHRDQLQATRLKRTGSTLAKNSDYGMDRDRANIAALQKKGLVPQNYGRVAEGELAEGWDDMLKAADERRREGMRSGEKTQGHKGEIEKTATGIKHTRRYDTKTGETDSDDDEKPAGEKRGRGRPKKTDKAPERVTSKAYKHKGGRKMSKEDIEEAIAALEEAGYSVEERKLTKPEMKKREEVVKSMKKNKGDFEQRYGERGEEVMYATATKMAKKKAEEVEETTVAGSVAPSAAAPKSKGKGGMTFGKGIYDSMNREVESMIAESMNVSVNMSMDETGTPRKNITISAQGEAAEQLAQLLNLAGMSAHSHEETCPTCGSADCGYQELDENQPDWPTDQETIGDDDPLMRRYAGGLNGPKSTGQSDGAPPNLQTQRQGVMDEAAPQSMQRVGKAAGEVLGAGIGFALGAIPGAIIGGVALGPGGAIGGGLGTGLPVAMTGTTLGGSAGRSAANFTHDTLVNAWRKASAKLGGPEATAEFIKAHAQAADYGKDAFDFGGKKYAVTMDRMQARKAMNDLAKMTAGSKEPVSEESVKVEESVDELTKLWKTYKG